MVYNKHRNYSNVISNELKGLNWLLLLVRAEAGLLPLNQNSQKHGPSNNRSVPSVPESSTVVYRLINNGIFVLCLYRQKIRIMLEWRFSQQKHKIIQNEL